MNDEKKFFELVITPVPADKDFRGFEIKSFTPYTKEELKEFKILWTRAYLRGTGLTVDKEGKVIKDVDGTNES